MVEGGKISSDSNISWVFNDHCHSSFQPSSSLPLLQPWLFVCGCTQACIEHLKQIPRSKYKIHSRCPASSSHFVQSSLRYQPGRRKKVKGIHFRSSADLLSEPVGDSSSSTPFILQTSPVRCFANGKKTEDSTKTLARHLRCCLRKRCWPSTSLRSCHNAIESPENQDSISLVHAAMVQFLASDVRLQPCWLACAYALQGLEE